MSSRWHKRKKNLWPIIGTVNGQKVVISRWRSTRDAHEGWVDALNLFPELNPKKGEQGELAHLPAEHQNARRHPSKV
ncbi:MAG: hypothetical protein HY459_03905 [Parcubacteria group bacterium]|nr:hypothetical protein [Parcubacteria group bacterium]